MQAYPGLFSAREVQSMQHAAVRAGVRMADLADVLQEAAVSLWQTAQRGTGIAHLMARRHAVELMRNEGGRRSQWRTESLPDGFDVPAPDDAAGGAKVREALRSLPAQQLELAGRLIDADDGLQLARELGVSPALISERRKRLRAALAEYL